MSRVNRQYRFGKLGPFRNVVVRLPDGLRSQEEVPLSWHIGWNPTDPTDVLLPGSPEAAERDAWQRQWNAFVQTVIAEQERRVREGVEERKPISEGEKRRRQNRRQKQRQKKKDGQEREKFLANKKGKGPNKP